MDFFNNDPAFLELVSCPAYAVENGTVSLANSSAKGLFITAGTAAEQLIETGLEDYREMKPGTCLSLTVRASGKRFCAFISRKEGGDLFLLDQEEDDPIHNALFLASCALRGPLDRVINSTGNIRRMNKKLDPGIVGYLNEISRGANQIHRVVANMSDVIPYSQEELHCQMTDIAALLREIVEKAGGLLEKSDIRLSFSSSVEGLFVPVNQEKLERALHNLILNAATYTTFSRQPQIDVALKQVGQRLHISVTDNGRGINDETFSSLFYRYRRKPNIDNCRFGIGLGLPLVRAIAAAHGGTVLAERLEPCGTRMTMTLAILTASEKLLRAPRFEMDYAGEFDHALIELADVLKSQCYEQ